MNFKHFIWAGFLFLIMPASAQIGLPPSNNEDDDGILTPEYMNFLSDSGRVDAGIKVGFWKEHQFAVFMSGRKRQVRYDSMQHYDSLRRHLRFYKSEGEYVDGKREGEWKTYVCYKKRLPLNWSHESTETYVAGHRQGWQERFNKSGAFVGKVFFKDDLEDSIAYFYYRTGELASTSHYRKGKVHGKSIFYKENGEVLFEFIYKNGERIGSVMYYGHGAPPQIEGEHESFHDNGKLKSSSQYRRGELEGSHKTYYPNGNPEKEMIFKNGGIDGTFKEYFDNGQLQHERIYKEGRLWEVVQTFSRNGKSLTPGTLKDGNGSVMTYNQNGKLLTTSIYRSGILQRPDTND